MSREGISPLAQQIVVAAFAYAGPNTGNEKVWRQRMSEGVLRAAAAINGKPAWDAQDMLDAHVFAGTYNGYEFEETSTRCDVKIASDTGRDKDKDADGNERIRTDRTDGYLGERMRQRLDSIPVGSRILAWKVLETAKDGNKVRVLKHFEVLQLNKDSAPVGPPPAAPRATGAVEPTPAPVADPPAGWDAVIERVNALTNRGKVAFVKACRDAEPPLLWMNPPDDQVDAILVVLSKVEKE